MALELVTSRNGLLAGLTGVPAAPGARLSLSGRVGVTLPIGSGCRRTP
jgi:hypothetical protein